MHRIVRQLISHVRIIRPDICILPFRDQWTRQWGLTGVLVREVQVGSAAALAGLLPTRVIDEPRTRGYSQILFGDLIVAADGDTIKDLNDWFTFLEKHETGNHVELSIVRGAHTPEQEQVQVRLVLEDSEE